MEFSHLCSSQLKVSPHCCVVLALTPQSQFNISKSKTRHNFSLRQALDPSYHAFFQFIYFSPIVYVLINAPRLGVHHVHEAEILAHGDVEEDIVDAAKTIILCAQHQKRIGTVIEPLQSYLL
jgi:hypothetical protein